MLGLVVEVAEEVDWEEDCLWREGCGCELRRASELGVS